MARISGVDLPREKRVEIGLTYIYGIGRTSADQILKAQCADDNIRFQGFQPILQLLSVQVHQGKIIISSY